jgi:hypothetical protein
MSTKTKYEPTIPNGTKWAPRKADIYYVFSGNGEFPGSLDVKYSDHDYLDSELCSSLIVKGVNLSPFRKAIQRLPEPQEHLLINTTVIGSW